MHNFPAIRQWHPALVHAIDIHLSMHISKVLVDLHGLRIIDICPWSKIFEFLPGQDQQSLMSALEAISGVSVQTQIAILFYRVLNYV